MCTFVVELLNVEEGKETLSGQVFKSKLDLFLKDNILIKMKKIC